MEHYGLLSLLPTLFVITCAVLTHRPIASLLLGVVVGLLLIDPTQVVSGLADVSLSVMMDESIGWVILVCGLFGSIIFILIRTGAAISFSRAIVGFANTRNKSIMVTWLLGILLFIDDYLNAIAIGSSMKRATDKFKISRAMLSYIVDSTAAPTCVIIPISTWAVFFATVLEASNVVEKGAGMDAYISAIPYMFYPFVALLMVPLVATGKIPFIGLMKKAEAKAAEGIVALEPMPSIGDDAEPESHEGSGIWTFLIPMLALIGFSAFSVDSAAARESLASFNLFGFFGSFSLEIDVLKGVIIALAITIPLMVYRKLMTLFESLDAVMEGFRVMLPPLAIVVVAFMFKTVNDQLGLPTYVIETVTPLMTPLMFPVVTFATMALVSFATGSSWGIFAIAIPIIVPLGLAIGVDLPLIIGAMLSASAFGSHACFYGDATVLSAQSCGISVMEHSLTQLPYAVIAAVISCLMFVAVSSL